MANWINNHYVIIIIKKKWKKNREKHFGKRIELTNR